MTGCLVATNGVVGDAGPDVGVEAEGLARRDVQALEAAALGRRDRGLEEDLRAPQRFPRLGRDAGAVAGEVDFFADLDLLDREARAGGLEDVERGRHDLRADAVAVRDGDGNCVAHGVVSSPLSPAGRPAGRNLIIRSDEPRRRGRAPGGAPARRLARDRRDGRGRVRGERDSDLPRTGRALAKLPTRRSRDGGRVRRDPRLVWEWYAWRRGLVAAARPNRAHEVLALWSRRFPRFRLITQNVDGLHERAGTSGVIRFHGSLWEVSCWDACGRMPARWRDERTFESLPPRCDACGGWLRPGVVWFGEPIDPEALEASGAALDCEVCLAVGTSAVVYPAAGLVTAAGSRGAFTAEINPEATPASGAVDLAIAGPAEDVLDRVDRRL